MPRPRKNPNDPKWNQEKSALITPSNAPASGGSVQEPVREQIKQMTGFSSEQELEAALPENTNLPTEEAPKRKRRTKAEMLAQSSSPDSLMQDERYARTVGKMTGLGAPRVIKAGFKAGAVALKDEKIELQRDEISEVEDYFYVVGKKANFDPTSKWYLIIYFLALMTELIGKRVLERSGMKSKLAEFFGMPAPGLKEHVSDIPEETE